LSSAAALPKYLEGSKNNNFAKPGKDPKFPKNLRPISLLFKMGKLFENVIQKFVQKHIEERGLLNANQFGFRARPSTTLKYMSTAALFLDIYKAFDTIWHYGLLYNLYNLEFSTNLIKLLGFFLSQENSGYR
jgi:hypothetical protein